MTKLNNFTELITLLTCTNHLHVHANQQRNYVSMVTQTCGRINEKRNRLDLTLIRLDFAFLFRAIESRYGLEGTPDAIKMVLGWVLFGSASSPSFSEEDPLGYSCMNVAQSCMDVSLSPHEHDFACELEGLSSQEDRAYRVMKESIQLVNGQFQLPLLWRERNTVLPDNRSMAEHMLQALKRRLVKDKELHGGILK